MTMAIVTSGVHIIITMPLSSFKSGNGMTMAFKTLATKRLGFDVLVIEMYKDSYCLAMSAQ